MQINKSAHQDPSLRHIWPANLIELRECPLCSSVEIKFVTKRLDGLKLYECKVCGLSFVNPKPTIDAILAYYDSDYFTGNRDFHSGRNYLDESIKRYDDESQAGFKELIKHIDITGKSILEIGCGTGVLLALCKKYGAALVKGYDLSKEATDYGINQFKIDLGCGRFEDEKSNSEKYDVIIMIDVIEHIYDVKNFLVNLRNVLNKNGIIYFLTPNWQGYSYAKSKWTPLSKDFEHLQYFSKLSFNYTACMIDLTCILIYTDGYPFQLKQYKVHGNRFTNIITNPTTAISNTISKFKFKINTKRNGKYIGHNLYCFLKDQ